MLPSPWVKAVSKSTGEVYYFNTRTGASQWAPPEPEASAPPAAAVRADDAKAPDLFFNVFHPEFRADGVYRASTLPAPSLLRQLEALVGDVTRYGALSSHELARELEVAVCHRGLEPDVASTGGTPAAYHAFHESDRPLAGPKGVGGGTASLLRRSSQGLPPSKRARRVPDFTPTPLAFPVPRGSELYTCDELLVRTENDVIREIYRTGETADEDGIVKKLVSAISPLEGKHLYDAVRRNGFSACLEVCWTARDLWRRACALALTLCRTIGTGWHGERYVDTLHCPGCERQRRRGGTKH